MIKYTERLILGLLVASVTTNDNPDEEIKTLPPHMDNELNELNDITYYNNLHNESVSIATAIWVMSMR